MKVTKEGVYKDARGTEFQVFDVGFADSPHFRAYWCGGYYDVNEGTDNAPGEVWEMVEFVCDFEIDNDGVKF